MTNGPNPATVAATAATTASNAAIVAAVATARRRVQAHFMALHAITPDDTIEYAPPGRLERKQFDWLRANGVIRAAAPGNYWLDMSRLDAVEERRRRKWVPILLAAAIGLAMFALLFYRG